MATRQYIGARYVPIFADPVEWDNTRAYEHLMMVQHQGETYISQQAVPIGIDLPDTSQGEESNEYWVHMSNWNAQVEQYREEVLQYNSRISTIAENAGVSDTIEAENSLADLIEENEDSISMLSTNTGVSSEEPAVKSLATLIGENEAAISNLAPRMASVESDYRLLQNGLALFFGDSVTAGYSLVDRTTQAWPAVLSGLNGWTCKNYAVDGAAFTNGIPGQIMTAVADTSFDNSDVKYVFVGGGINDHDANLDTLGSAVSVVCQALVENFPNAHYYFVPNLCAQNPLNTVYPPDNNMFSSQRIIQVLRQTTYNVNYFTDSYRWLTGWDAYSSDHIHPNATGHVIIARKINSIMKGGLAYGDLFDSKDSITYDSTFATKITPVFNEIQSDGLTYKFYVAFDLKVGESISVGETIATMPPIARQDPNHNQPVIATTSNGTVLPFFISGSTSLRSFFNYTNNTADVVGFYLSGMGIVGIG